MLKHLTIFCVLFFLCALITKAQPTVVQLNNPANKNNYVALQQYLWQYKAGDNLQWANPTVNDSNWRSTTTHFNPKNVPPEWQGYGWFRIWIKKDSLSTFNTWGLRINHDGASQIFWDGKPIGSVGFFSTNAANIKVARAPYTIFPLSISDTVPHLLAIRYSNFKTPFDDFAGFQVWLGNTYTLNQQAFESHRNYGYYLLSPAVQMMLVLLHLLLFLFYPKQKIHLYYSIYVLVVLLAALARYYTVVSTDPNWQYLCYWVFIYALVLIPITSALLFYYVSYNYIPKVRFIIIGILTLALIAYVITQSNPSLLNGSSTYILFINSLTLLVLIDGLIVISKAIKRGDKLLWLIAVAMFINLTASVVVGSNMYNWFTLQQVMMTMSIVSLVLPVMFSVYLAINIARTNRSLELQLTENKKLAAHNLQQEQEKTKLIAGQAEELERTVMERTAQVRRQAEKLREMDEAKSRFFVNLTHEFKTPLTLIINPAKELLQQSNEAASRQYAQFILQNSERLLQLINQLLDLSKLESGQLTVDNQPLEIVQWLRTFSQQFSSMADKNNITIQFQSTQPQLWLMADVDKLEKMVQNLISNAIKFSVHNGTIKVVLNKADNNTFSIAVQDNGIGIAPNKLPYIFDRFYQADATDTRSGEGVGIGLALTKELAELLGGQITVTSNLNEGSSFTLQLPLIAATENSILPIITTAKANIQNQVIQNADDELPLILLAEDNADLRDFITLSFANQYNIITAKNGEEGITLAFEKIPLLVITDLMMPQKNGYQLCEALKTDARTSHIPIIMLTAKTDADSRIQGIETGADAYLPKPFDKRELLAVTQNLIRIRQQLREKYGKDNVWLTNAEQLPSIEQTFLNNVRQAIETHLDDTGYGADQLGQDIALSRTQLHRKLKQLINQSPGELIRSIRMQRAHELLQQNIATVAEVCYMVGYGNPANFSTSFSKHFGYPPSEVAKTK